MLLLNQICSTRIWRVKIIQNLLFEKVDLFRRWKIVFSTKVCFAVNDNISVFNFCCMIKNFQKNITFYPFKHQEPVKRLSLFVFKGETFISPRGKIRVKKKILVLTNSIFYNYWLFGIHSLKFLMQMFEKKIL